MTGHECRRVYHSDVRGALDYSIEQPRTEIKAFWRFGDAGLFDLDFRTKYPCQATWMDSTRWRRYIHWSRAVTCEFDLIWSLADFTIPLYTLKIGVSPCSITGKQRCTHGKLGPFCQRIQRFPTAHGDNSNQDINFQNNQVGVYWTQRFEMMQCLCVHVTQLPLSLTSQNPLLLSFGVTTGVAGSRTYNLNNFEVGADYDSELPIFLLILQPGKKTATFSSGAIYSTWSHEPSTAETTPPPEPLPVTPDAIAPQSFQHALPVLAIVGVLVLIAVLQ